MISDHPKLSNPSEYIRAVNNPVANTMEEKYSISLRHTRPSVSSMSVCPEGAEVREILDVEVTSEMFLSLSRGNMVVVARPHLEESCQVSYVLLLNKNAFVAFKVSHVKAVTGLAWDSYSWNEKRFVQTFK